MADQARLKGRQVVLLVGEPAGWGEAIPIIDPPSAEHKVYACGGITSPCFEYGETFGEAFLELVVEPFIHSHRVFCSAVNSSLSPLTETSVRSRCWINRQFSG